MRDLLPSFAIGLSLPILLCISNVLRSSRTSTPIFSPDYLFDLNKFYNLNLSFLLYFLLLFFGLLFCYWILYSLNTSFIVLFLNCCFSAAKLSPYWALVLAVWVSPWFRFKFKFTIRIIVPVFETHFIILLIGLSSAIWSAPAFIKFLLR